MPSNMFDQFDEPEEVALQQAPPAQPASNMFDQFDDPEPGPQQFDLRATREINTPTVFDQENASYQPIPQEQMDAYQASVRPALQQGLADFLAPAMDGAERLLKPLGFSWENARQGQQEMEDLSWQEQAATNLAGVDVGMAKIGDALINFPAGLVQQAAGVAPQDRWRSDMQGALESWAPVAARKQAAPHAFNVGEGVGGAVAPIPLLGPAPLFKGWQAAIKAGSPKAVIGNIMAGGGIVGGALGGGEAVKQNRQIEPMDVVAPALAGGLTAGLVTGGVVGLAKGSGALAKAAARAAKDAQQQVKQASEAAATKAVAQYNKLRPTEQKQMLQGVVEHNEQQAATAQRLMNSLGINDAESRAAVGAMSRQVTDGLPLAPPPTPIGRNPNPRLPKTLRDAKPKYQNWKPQFGSDLDMALYTIANRSEKSRADDRYFKWVQEVTGWDDATIVKHAREVKDAVKGAPRSSAENFSVPRTSNKHLEQTEAAVEAVHAAKTPEESKEAIQGWAEQVTGKPAHLGKPITKSIRETQEYDVEHHGKAFRPLETGMVHKYKSTDREVGWKEEAEMMMPQQLTDRELEVYWQEMEIKIQSKRTQFKARRKYEDNQTTINQEQMRRKEHRLNGWHESWMQEDGVNYAGLSDAELHEAAMSGNVHATHEIEAREFKPVALSEATEQMPALPTPVMGDFRKTLSPEFYGRNKNKLATPIKGHAVFDKPEVHAAVNEIAERKARQDYDEAVYEDFLKKVWKEYAKKGDEEITLSNGAIITRREVEPKPADWLQAKIDTARSEFETGVETPLKPNMAAMLTERFGKNSREAHIEHVDLPATEPEAAAKLAELQDLAKTAKKNYEATKLYKIQERLDKVQEMIEKRREAKKPNFELIQKLEAERAQLEADKEFAAFADKVLTDAEKANIEHTGDKFQQLHVKTEVDHPLGAQHGMVEVGIEFRKGAQRKIIPPENMTAWGEKQSALMREDANRTPHFELSANFRGVTKAGAVMAGVIGALSHQAAGAAEIGAKVASHPDVLAIWNHFPINELAIAAAIVKLRLPQKAAQKLLSDEMTMVGKVPVGAIWKDTLDHISYADKVLNAAARKQAAEEGWHYSDDMDKSLHRDIWNRLGQAMRAVWGVKISPEKREAMLGALREGHITMEEAIQGRLDDVDIAEPEALEAIKLFEGAGPEIQKQRNAVVMYRMVQKDIMSLVADRHDELREWRMNPPADKGERATFDAMQPAVKQALVSMEFMMRQLGKRSESVHPVDEVMGKAVANWMDFNFFWNPDHHGTNLTDMFIAGAPRVGFRNLWRANKLLRGNAELRTLFKNSNLTGGYRADQAEIIANVGSKGKIWTENDLQSDLVNSDRVFLAHALQYFQKHEKDILASGFKGDDLAFVKALYKDEELNPEIVMDVWANSAEVLSRTLGVDVYRINTNIINQAPVARSIGIFMRQPARLSRLAMNYMAEGNHKALFTMFGITLALGGRAAIPVDWKWLGDRLNPDSANKAAALADTLDLYYRASGERLGPKITWSFIWPLLGSTNPVINSMKGGYEFSQGLAKGDWERIGKGIKDIIPFTIPRAGGAPMGMGVRLFDSIKAAFWDREKKAYVERDGQLQMAETGRKPLTNPFDQVRHAAGPLVPGRDAWADAYKMSKDETHFSRENYMRGIPKLVGLGGLVPPPRKRADQYYSSDSEPYDITRQGFNNGYNLLDALAGRTKK